MMKKRSGQASLEMVIGLIILLVVAAVVISLVLYFLRKENIPNPQEELSIRNFLDKCESLCKDMTTLDYCKYYYPGNDWDKNGIKNEIVKVGKYEWPACEDRVYCFLVSPCEERFGSGLEAIKKCKRLLCQTYLEKYDGDVNLANQALWDDISFSMKCSLDEYQGPDNWYEKVIKPGCGEMGGGSGGVVSQVTFSCIGPTAPDSTLKQTINVKCSGDVQACKDAFADFNFATELETVRISDTEFNYTSSCETTNQLSVAYCKAGSGSSIEDVVGEESVTCQNSCQDGKCI